MLDVVPHLLANHGVEGVRFTIDDLDRWAIEPKVDGLRGPVAYLPAGRIELLALSVAAVTYGTGPLPWRSAHSSASRRIGVE